MTPPLHFKPSHEMEELMSSLNAQLNQDFPGAGLNVRHPAALSAAVNNDTGHSIRAIFNAVDHAISVEKQALQLCVELTGTVPGPIDPPKLAPDGSQSPTPDGLFPQLSQAGLLLDRHLRGIVSAIEFIRGAV